MKTYEEKREFLLKKFEFPCRAVLYLHKGEEGFAVLISCLKGQKKKLENVRFSEIQAFCFDGNITPVYVGDFDNVDDLLIAVEVEGDKWLDNEIAE